MRTTIKVLLLAGFFLLPIAPLDAQVRFRYPMSQYYNDPPALYYYDNDASGGLRSWQCRANTYNGHTGTDFRTGGQTGRSVYAGAIGSLYQRVDSCPTWGYSGSSCGGGYGNHVRIAHASPWVSIYAHLAEGWQNVRGYSSVLCGAWVGNSGSSGNSTGPHLHFEVRRYGYPNDDPYSGSCSGSTSFWVNQNNGWPTTQCQ